MKKNEVTIRSSAAEYLTFIAVAGYGKVSHEEAQKSRKRISNI